MRTCSLLNIPDGIFYKHYFIKGYPMQCIQNFLLLQIINKNRTGKKKILYIVYPTLLYILCKRF